MLLKYSFDSRVKSIHLNSPLKPLGSNVTLEKSMLWSSTRTEHLVVRCLYINDWLQVEGVNSIIYRLTEEMEIAYS